MQTEIFRAMNSDIVLVAEGELSRIKSGFLAAKDFIDTSEKRFTRFSEQSELSALNHSAGTWFRASADLFEVVREAGYYFQKTNGFFDPSILPRLQNAGYIQSMDEIRRTGVTSQPVDQLPARTSSFSSIQLDENTTSIRLPVDLQIDLGGIAKGWIAERAAHLLNEYAPVCAVNAGGDMFMIGHPYGEDAWEIGLEDPRNPQENITVLLLQEGAIATSSVMKRSWKQGNITRHHLIDPRTGEPSNTFWLSVTVLARHAATAETFAKAFLIADKEEAQLLGEQNPELTVLAVDRDGNLVSLVKPRKLLYVNH